MAEQRACDSITIPPTCAERDPVRTCIQHTPGPCNFGDKDLCNDPAFVDVCTDDYPCNEDIPPVVIEQMISTSGHIAVYWEGEVDTDEVELMVNARFTDLVDHPTPVYGLIDRELEPDVNAPNEGQWVNPTALDDEIMYTVFCRRVRNGECSIWTGRVIKAESVEVEYIEDDDDNQSLIVDDDTPDVESPWAIRVITTFIVDDDSPT